MVRDRPGRQTGDREEHAPRLAPSGVGPLPAVAGVSWPMRVLGRRRGTQTARTGGPDAAALVGPRPAVGADAAGVAAGPVSPRGGPRASPAACLCYPGAVSTGGRRRDLLSRSGYDPRLMAFVPRRLP